MSETEPSSSLDDALHALQEADAEFGVSSGVADRLRSEVRTIGRTRRRRQYASGVAAAGLLLGVIVTSRPRTPAPAMPAPTTSTTRVSNGEIATAFFPLIYGNVPASDGHLVRLEVPRAALTAFGLGTIEAVDESSSSTVSADVLVGEDGLARAVRFVRPTGR